MTVSSGVRALAIAMGFILPAGLAGCLGPVSERDVFRPELAERSTISVSINGAPVFLDNKPVGDPWAGTGVTTSQTTTPSPVGDLAITVLRRAEADAPLFVYCGGSSFATPEHGAYVLWLLAAEGDAVVWDYPGYGDSAGEPTLADLRAAAGAVAAAIPQFQRTPDQPVIFWGHSLGGFVCAELAAQAETVDAFVFEASGSNATAAVRAPAPALLRPLVRLDPALAAFDNVAAAAQLDAPILILAGQEDDILPERLSRQLKSGLEQAGADVAYAAFSDAGHFDIVFHAEFSGIIRSFLEAAGVAGPPLARPPIQQAMFQLSVVTD